MKILLPTLIVVLGLMSIIGCSTFAFWDGESDDARPVASAPAALEERTEEIVEESTQDLSVPEVVVVEELVEELKPVFFDQPIQIQAPDTSRTP
jgi:hypothetical protein